MMSKKHAPISVLEDNQENRRASAPQRPVADENESMSTYKELLAKQRELDAQIAAARNEERAQAIATIRELMQQFEITMGDLAVKQGAYKRGPSTAKYRDPASGATWSGRGREPRWIAGKDRAAFAV